MEIADCSETNIKDHEQLNIEIKSSKNKFLDYFYNMIKKKESKINKKEIEEYDFEIYDSQDENKITENIFLLKEKKKQVDLISQMINNIDLTIENHK